MKKTLIAIAFTLISSCLFASEKTEFGNLFPVVKTQVPQTSFAGSHGYYVLPWTIDFTFSCGELYGAQYTPAPGATMEEIFADLDAYANYFQMYFCGVPGNPTWMNI